MKKLAVFVEGQTELLFVEKLLIEMAGGHKIRIEKVEARGGRSSRQYVEIDGKAVGSGQEYHAMIVDSHGDQNVKSDILDRYSWLVSQGYELVIGIRDVFPTPRADLPKLRLHLYDYVKSKPLKVILVLAVMEVEAWFLAECSHFPRIHPTLTDIHISTNVGYDPCHDDMELRENPADDLRSIYQLVGLTYNQRKANTSRTIEALDWAVVYASLPNRVPSLQTLVDTIDSFLR